MSGLPLVCLAGFDVPLPDGMLHVRCCLDAHGERGHLTHSGFEWDTFRDGEIVDPRTDPESLKEVVEWCRDLEAGYLVHIGEPAPCRRCGYPKREHCLCHDACPARCPTQFPDQVALLRRNAHCYEARTVPA